MEVIFASAIEGFSLVFSWPNILYPIVGTVLAMCVATIPGLSGFTLMALAIPFTLHWDSLPIMLLFGSFLGGGTFMGSVSSILLNIPGKASNAATTLDGYPLAQKGQAKTAIACSATASALGSTVGVVVLMLLIPVFEPIILAVGPPEFLLLVVWGLTTVVIASRGPLLKNALLVGLGFLLASVGFDFRTAELRFTMGSLSLSDGLGFVPVFLGIFAVAETIALAVTDRPTISGRTRPEQLSGNLWAGIGSVFRNFGLFLRSSFIGIIVGMVPGIGGTVASFVAYGHASRSDRSGRFGKGDIRGVLAPEAANDAKDAGALIPTLTFGVPGGGGTALLLAVLTLHGLVPGRALLNEQLSLVFVLIWSLFFSNWLTSLLGVGLVNPLVRITLLPTQVLVPVILTLVCLGAYLSEGKFSDMILTLLFGIFGYGLRRFRWPRIPFVIAFVLGPLLERYLHLSHKLWELGRIDLQSRPLIAALLLLIVLTILFSSVSRGWKPGVGRER